LRHAAPDGARRASPRAGPDRRVARAAAALGPHLGADLQPRGRVRPSRRRADRGVGRRAPIAGTVAPMTTHAAAHEQIARLVANVERVIFGKRKQTLLAVVGLLAEGHVLIEDVPGTGKTTLARALARSLDLTFRRIQFTSDLLPSDVLGVSVLDAATGEFVFKRGPVFADVLLADELNRTTPRTQSALLECMSDRRVSMDGKTYDLPRPFLVLATQNPLEFEGTYPLPESQLDRFLMRVAMGYPPREDERRVLRTRSAGEDVDRLASVLTRD